MPASSGFFETAAEVDAGEDEEDGGGKGVDDEIVVTGCCTETEGVAADAPDFARRLNGAGAGAGSEEEIDGTGMVVETEESEEGGPLTKAAKPLSCAAAWPLTT